ncbi:PAS domain-containing sensor histidine kinase [Bacillus sp. V3-13]|uniref:ATP-binding protein n=1 Tax=Bacillus sp. V3-13 TaxID=2053728 RepID=UPI000C76C9C7|nr:ATP-binding protein [Bacillus sp. V3-13]PLR76610.1 PAS domain-containing sensor histidine kinase [Bacillus sp. V3-13]
MKKTGQIVLVSISILFTLIQSLFFNDPIEKETVDFILATAIAWFVGWHLDKVKFYARERKESEESYKQLIESLPESVIIHHNGIILYVNKAAEIMAAARSKEELIGRSIFDFLPREEDDLVKERIEQVYKEKKPLMNFEHRVTRLDGKTIFFEESSLYILFEGKEAVLSIGKDITDRKEKTERLLQKSEKLALVGQMAAGIAHEIRNPLTSIKGFIQLFRSNNSQEEYFEIVLAELERINLIVGEFLVLAKPTAIVFQEKNLKNLIKDVVMLINTQSILNNVQIFVEFGADIPNISCEENQLKQLFINILKNGIEAMPMGGTIDLKVEKKEDGKVSILFIDHGVGIPEERIPTLGEPFYTTKEKGTGLGLMTCYKIVETHNGELNITSKVGQGTTIEIILPVLTKEHINEEITVLQA